MISELKPANIVRSDAQTDCRRECYQYDDLSYDVRASERRKVEIPDLRPELRPAEVPAKA